MADSRASRWPAYARVPPFLPVPVRARAGGWSAERQVRFIGFLAETGSVSEAARRVEVSRLSAYRLRARPGAESFAHAWDTVLAFHAGKSQTTADFPKRKVTAGELAEMAEPGPVHIVMQRKKFLGALRKPSASALLRHMRRLDALAARGGWDR